MQTSEVRSEPGLGEASQGQELEALVAAAARGDTQAFGRVVAMTAGLVSSIAVAILRDVDQSNDIAQEVFLSAWRDLKRLRSPASFLPWLRQMTRNQAHSSLRSRVRGRRWLAPFFNEHAEIADERPTATDNLLAAEQRAVLRQALAELPDNTREPLLLFYRQGQSVAQTAALLQVSEDAIKKRLSRARQALRSDVLERLGETLGASAPGVTFGLTVLAAISVAAPVQAAAMSASAAKAAGAGTVGSLGTGLLWLLKLALPVTLLSSFGVAGAWLGARHFVRIARDERERRQMRQFWAANMLTYVAAAVGFELRAKLFQHWGDLVVFGAFTLALLALHLVWLPKIVRRRYEAEMREDPLRASSQRRRARLGKIVGWGLGLGISWVALVIKHVCYAH